MGRRKTAADSWSLGITSRNSLQTNNDFSSLNTGAGNLIVEFLAKHVWPRVSIKPDTQVSPPGNFKSHVFIVSSWCVYSASLVSELRFYGKMMYRANTRYKLANSIVVPWYATTFQFAATSMELQALARLCSYHDDVSFLRC